MGLYKFALELEPRRSALTFRPLARTRAKVSFAVFSVWLATDGANVNFRLEYADLALQLIPTGKSLSNLLFQDRHTGVNLI